MKRMTLATTMVCLLASLPALGWGKTCKTSDSKGTRCTLHVKDIRPAQFAVGSVAVDCKAAKIGGKSEKKLEKYLEDEKRLVPAVVGPDGNFYMTDHHHLSTALFRAKSDDWGKKHKVLHIEILDNYTEREMLQGEFWGAMQELHFTYNHDNKGIAEMNFGLLPTNVGEMLNDPYRTLSRWVRESCGYVKAGKEQCSDIRTDHEHKAPFFMEFYWGDFFRENLELPRADLAVCESIPYSQTCLADEITALKDIYPKAMELAKSAAAETYLKEQGLDPWEYGYNPGGEHVELSWSGDQEQCDETDE